ncbi:type I polyketide synthase [Nocardia sp. BMG51109]|uniref:type I polyketide synthase n=1 Tax=Nocardia sp. BMG51109 TaxID=1056816 RepID=UPI0004661712|nr:type I polyketide synthase [Nocardia sp. BMG51109]
MSHAELSGADEHAGADAPDSASRALDLLQHRYLSERQRLLMEMIRRQVDAVLGDFAPENIDVTAGFVDLGLDSRTAVELRDRVAAETGIALPAAVIFDHPTIEALAAHLSEPAGAEAEAASSAAAHPAAAADDPIAIVGMACRFPGGVATPDDLWRLVAEGRDAITGFPADRGWPLDDLYDPEPGVPGKSYVREGGFLDGAAEFDAGFFGISAREALATDPQQRMLLELAWEAFERARIDPAALRGTETGVFLGLSDMGYRSLLAAGPDLAGAESYLLTGNMPAVASGRIAYFLGLQGPAVTVDTACSSSLVALHHAAQSLRSGECSLALTGGVSVTMSPLGYVFFSAQRGLAYDARCKSYAAAADGTSWSEGAGVLVLERLSDARRNGHPVAAVVRGSATNQDGASNGLTAPNGLSQQRVIRQALANAGLSASDVDAVEGHGTGTVLGDPIEAQALLATYGQRPAEQPLLLGSIKSNIGHTQSAAGAAGLIKMILAMRHAAMPPTLHVDTPSPHVDWSAGHIRLVTESRPWPERDRPRRAGISSFGISGTNAHVILEYDPAWAEPVAADGDSVEGALSVCVLSARTDGALRGQAERLRAACVADDAPDVASIALSAATTRTGFDRRAALVVADRTELADGLAALAQGAGASGAVTGRAGSAPKVAILLPGQGSQAAGMGRQLYEAYPEFARVFDELCGEFDRHLDHPLRAVIFDTDDTGLLDRTDYTQPALFTVEVALLHLLRSWGVVPDYLLGHSIGELAAAHAGGVFPTADAAAVVAARGRLMQRLRPGAMLSVRASDVEVAESIVGQESTVAIAASNGPNATVVSGDEEAVTAIGKYWRARGRRTKRLRVERAFHSPHLDGMLDEYRRVVAAAGPRSSAIPVVSNVTGEFATTEQLCSPDYWVAQARHAVLFRDGVHTLADAGATLFLEAGPGEALAGMTHECLTDGGHSVAAALRRGQPEVRSLLRAVATAWTTGATVDWAAMYAGRGARVVDLPTYAFQHRRYWSGTTAALPAVEQRPDGAPDVDPGQRFRDDLAALPESERLEFAAGVVRSQLAEILLELDGEIAGEANLFEAGLTSLSMLELRSRLNQVAGTSISLESLITHPTVRDAARLLTGVEEPVLEEVSP